MAKNNHKRTCWVFQMEWELYDERNSQVELFNSLHKAQKRMSECIKEDVKNYIDRFDTFEYDDLDNNGITVHNKLPMEIFKDDDNPLNTKWATFYQEYDSDFITYSINKREIK